jgi:hypothetical protein
VFFNINPIHLDGEQGGAALQEKDVFDVAAVRLQGTAPSWRSLLELMCPGIATALRHGTGATAASGLVAPDRSDGESPDNGSKRLGKEQGGLPCKEKTSMLWPR